MDQRVKGLWTDALRSGEYEQAQGVLTKVDEFGNATGHCCLGVLCDLAVREGVIQPGVLGNVYDEIPGDSGYRAPDRPEDYRLIYGNVVDDLGGAAFTTRYQQRSHAELPKAVQEWAGLREGVPEVSVPRDAEDIQYDIDDGIENPDEYTTEGVASVNDDGADFLTIADMIEKDL